MIMPAKLEPLPLSKTGFALLFKTLSFWLFIKRLTRILNALPFCPVPECIGQELLMSTLGFNMPGWRTIRDTMKDHWLRLPDRLSAIRRTRRLAMEGHLFLHVRILP
jgi:hypothetical protein